MQGNPLFIPAIIGDLALQSADAVDITGGTITGITDLAIADGGTGASTAAAARTNLGATTVGSNLFTLPNPGAIRFPRLNADNSVSALSDADFRAAINAQSANGNLDALAALSFADGNFIVGNGMFWGVRSGATARTALGLGTIATNDISQGTWTPAYVLTTSGSVTVGSGSTGTWLRIGNWVYLTGYLVSSGVSSPVGFVRISLPFPVKAGSNLYSLTVGVAGLWATAMTLQAYISTSSSTTSFLLAKNATNGPITFVAAVDLTTGSPANQLVFSGWYEVA